MSDEGKDEVKDASNEHVKDTDDPDTGKSKDDADLYALMAESDNEASGPKKANSWKKEKTDDAQDEEEVKRVDPLSMSLDDLIDSGRPKASSKPSNNSDVCQDFKRGNCSRGSNCKYTHEGDGNGGGDAWDGARKRKWGEDDDWKSQKWAAKDDSWSNKNASTSGASWSKNAGDKWGDKSSGYKAPDKAYEGKTYGQSRDVGHSGRPTRDRSADRVRANGRGGRNDAHDAGIDQQRPRLAMGKNVAGQNKIVVVGLAGLDLGRRDLEQAFSASGTVESCQLGRNSATIVYTTATQAKDAVRRFNGGKLNDRAISVYFDGEEPPKTTARRSRSRGKDGGRPVAVDRPERVVKRAASPLRPARRELPPTRGERARSRSRRGGGGNGGGVGGDRGVRRSQREASPRRGGVAGRR